MQFTNLNIITISIFITIILVIGYFGYKNYFKQINFNKQFNLLSSFKYFYIKYIFLFISLFIILIASFGVKYGEKKVQNEAKGIDMMFVLDVSKSMNVADIVDSNYAYTRLDVIKDSIAKFVANHKQDRFGLIIFAGDAVSTIPLTTDHDLFLTFLKGVDYRNLTKQGSDFAKALKLGIDRFSNSDDRSKALIFISDGGDPDDNINKTTFENIVKNIKGINYFVVGVGTNKGGKIIKGRDAFGRYIYQKYNGKYVVSKINRTNLKNITSALNGSYVEVNNIGDLSSLNKNINLLAKKVIKKSVNGELGDFGRTLSILSFIFFIFFLFMYLYENNFISLINKNENIK